MQNSLTIDKLVPLNCNSYKMFKKNLKLNKWGKKLGFNLRKIVMFGYQCIDYFGSLKIFSGIENFLKIPVKSVTTIRNLYGSAHFQGVFTQVLS